MNILLIPDKFKESLSAKEVIIAVKKGLARYNESVNVIEILASDGGDGFIEAISQNNAIKLVEMPTVNSLGRQLNATFALDSKKKVAYIELAKTSGLSLLEPTERNVLETSTYGMGLQIKQALRIGVKKIFLGLGGSATNDAGMGLAVALGYQFLDINGSVLKPCGRNLIKIENIIKPTLIEEIDKVTFIAVNDVKNPLFGLNGAAQTYAPQKGASPSDVKLLENGLKNLSSKVKSQFNIDANQVAGAGAAGGTAYGLKVFFDAKFESGVNFILKQQADLSKVKPKEIDLIITGEGKLDQQTLYGKLVYGVAKWGNKRKIPIVAICGKNTLSYKSAKTLNLLKIIEISDATQSLDYNMKYAAKLVEKAIFEFISQYKP